MTSDLSLPLVLALLSGAVALPASPQSPSADVGLISALEDSLWVTARDQRIQAFSSYLAAAYRGVYPDGVHDKARELATFPEVKIRSYQLNDLVVRPLGPGLYAITYRATVRGNYQGYDLHGDYWCSTVWQNHSGVWQAVLHTETKAP
jgi:hypothetical protein